MSQTDPVNELRTPEGEVRRPCCLAFDPRALVG